MKSMKTTILMVLVCILAMPMAAQSPDGLVYQAALRDDTGSEIPGEQIDLRFRFTSGSGTGTLVYQEEYSLTTSVIGTFAVVLGTGTRTGGTLASFSDINWSAAGYWLQVSIYYNSSWHDFPANQILSVPYALAARTAEDDGDRDPLNERVEAFWVSGNSLNLTEAGVTTNVDLSSFKDSPFAMNADTVTLMNGSLGIGTSAPHKSKLSIVSPDNAFEDALFEVKGVDGQTIFAVYNEGVRIYLPTDPLTKGPRGGFAVGGFDRAKGVVTEDYLWVTPDSIRMYIDKTPEGVVKGPARGGFAVGGFDRSKNIVDDYFHISADSTRFYIDDTQAKGPRGGFAVGGFDRAKGLRQDYMMVTTDSTRFFVRDSTAGFGISNVESGEPEGFLRIDKQNYFIGHKTGINSRPEDGAIYNSFIGYNAGLNNTTGRKNVFLGFRAGETNSTGFLNVFLGNQTGKNNVDGNQNIFIGEGSGLNNTGGDDNVFIGINSGQINTNGNANIYIGPQAGQNVISKSGNIFIGYQAGGLSGGSNNIFLGSSAGLYEANSFRLIIESNPTYLFTPLIYGDFVGRTLHINGTLSANVMAKSSDIRLKSDVETIGSTIDQVMRLNPVSFRFTDPPLNEYSLPEGVQFGLIAQELEEVFPELVLTDPNGYKMVDYSSLSSLLIPAIQELKSEMEQKDETIEKLKQNERELERRIEALELYLINQKENGNR